MRCIPVIFGIDVHKKYPIFFGAFYKYSYYCSINDWPIIAQEEYFIEPNYYKEKLGMNLDEVASINEIPDLNKINIKKIDKYIISNEETEKVLKNYKDKDDAWLKLMNNIDDTLYKILDEKMSLVMKKYNDIKYIFVWRHNATISKIADKYKLKVIEMELSGIRKNSYNFGLCYFQYSNKYSVEELNERYEKFIEETKDKKIPLLSRKDLINLCVSKKEIDNICKTEDYDVGVALGLRNDYEMFSTGSTTNEEILKELLKFGKGSNVLIRKHPANYNFKYPYENKFVLDNSVSSIQFVTRCKKIVSSVSNIGFEAMLFGKTSYTLGKMPFRRFCYESLDINDEYVINLKDLNFLFFCYFVPYSLVLTKEYMDFRTKSKSEYDIYMYHYNYIMKHHKIQKLYNNDDEINSLRGELEKTKQALGETKVENEELRKEINDMVNSKSWKITKPLRYVTGGRKKK